MSELTTYYNEFVLGHGWERESADECGCRGCGWFLSEVDTWHKCPTHNTGQRHPEDYDGDE